MIATLAGLGAALIFGFSMLAGAAASRRTGSMISAAWMMLIGFVVVVPWVAVSWNPLPDREGVFLMVYVGVTTAIGLVTIYAALRAGSVSVVIPIVSTEGAVSAAVAWVFGEVPSPLKVVGMLLVVGSVVALVSMTAVKTPAGPVLRQRRAVVMAIAAALLMGTMLYAQGKLGDHASLAWSVLPSRVATVALLAVPLAVRSAMRIDRRSLIFAATAGLTDVLGMVLFVIGSREDVAVTSVLASQYSVVGVLIGVVMFRERLTTSQWSALLGLLVGVAVVAISAS